MCAQQRGTETLAPLPGNVVVDRLDYMGLSFVGFFFFSFQIYFFKAAQETILKFSGTNNEFFDCGCCHKEFGAQQGWGGVSTPCGLEPWLRPLEGSFTHISGGSC